MTTMKTTRIARITNVLAATVCAAALCICSTGCEDDGGGGGNDVGPDNDRHTVAVIGDSISAGYGDSGGSWPSRLAGMLGCNVINKSVCGIRATESGGLMSSAISQKPGYVVIYLGANDAIHGGSAESVRASIVNMANAAKEAGCCVYVCNLTPMTGSHSIFDGLRRGINNGISAAAGDAGVNFINLAGAFGNGDGLLQGDGLHPNSAGQQKIADVVAGKLKGKVK